MKLSEILPLFEARKFPELNPKLSAYEQLKPYKDNPNIYISFTEINKLGINPLSKYNTPIGIYTYPLKEIWEHYKVNQYKSLKSLPFASYHPYIQIIQYNGNGTFIDVKDYDNLDNDIEKIKTLYTKNPSLFPTIGSLANLDYIIDIAKEEAKYNYPASKFFSICMYVTRYTGRSKTISKRKEGDKGYFPEFQDYRPNKSSRNWNKLLRLLGYAGFSDKLGLGIIHPSEPIQAFFTSKNVIKHLGTVLNKDYHKPSVTIGDNVKVIFGEYKNYEGNVLKLSGNNVVIQLPNYYKTKQIIVPLAHIESLNESMLFNDLSKNSKTINESLELSPNYNIFKFQDTKIQYNFHDGYINIASVRTPASKRGKGSARNAMIEFLKQSDNLNIPTKLSSSPLDKKTNDFKLLNFYKSLGYIETGRTINMLGDKELIRNVPSINESIINEAKINLEYWINSSKNRDFKSKDDLLQWIHHLIDHDNKQFGWLSGNISFDDIINNLKIIQQNGYYILDYKTSKKVKAKQLEYLTDEDLRNKQIQTYTNYYGREIGTSFSPIKYISIKKIFKTENTFESDVDNIKQALIDGKEIPPLLIRSDGGIIDGNHRYSAALQLNIKKVPVIILKSKLSESINESLQPFKPETIKKSTVTKSGAQGSKIKLNRIQFTTSKGNDVKIYFEPSLEDGEKTVDITFEVNDSMKDKSSYVNEDTPTDRDIIPQVFYSIFKYLDNAKINRCTFSALSSSADTKQKFNIPLSKTVKILNNTIDVLDKKISDTIISKEEYDRELEWVNAANLKYNRPLVSSVIILPKEELHDLLSKLKMLINSPYNDYMVSEFKKITSEINRKIGKLYSCNEFKAYYDAMSDHALVLDSYSPYGAYITKNRRLSIYSTILQKYYADKWNINILHNKFTLTRK